jgi:hypothetical protein
LASPDLAKSSTDLMTDTRYQHGPAGCRQCFAGSPSELRLGEWRLVNNPGYYGSSRPEILVLGFSKGANQNRAAEEGDFDRIAFANARDRLQQVLQVLGVMPKDRGIDSLMTATESQFGVASLVRCSFSKLKDGAWKTSGDVIPSAFKDPDTLKIVRTCASQYLGSLPVSVKLVVLLGTDDRYIEKTQSLTKNLHADWKLLNPVAFTAGGALWVYATHPSPGNGHFKSWTEGSADEKAGRKRELVLQAMRQVGWGVGA